MVIGVRVERRRRRERCDRPGTLKQAHRARDWARAAEQLHGAPGQAALGDRLAEVHDDRPVERYVAFTGRGIGAHQARVRPEWHHAAEGERALCGQPYSEVKGVPRTGYHGYGVEAPVRHRYIEVASGSGIADFRD